ncbi:hypothetical protein EON81_09825 [bacterium]|nr:MAG: hypothetical protein EON81_09825 [bacterium]
MDMNYHATFISVSEDCSAKGEKPASKEGKTSVAEVQLEMLGESPYRFTQEDVLFKSSTAARENPELTKEEFFSRPQACLRASALPKRYGWGIHFDSEGKAAAYPAGSDEYRKFHEDESLKQLRGMRSKRA